MWQKLINLSKAIVVQAAAGFPAASDDELEKRAKICDGCPLLDRENYKCTSCGCLLSYKLKWGTSKCPEGNW